MSISLIVLHISPTISQKISSIHLNDEALRTSFKKNEKNADSWYISTKSCFEAPNEYDIKIFCKKL